MKNKTKKIIALLSLCTIALVNFIGCNSEAESKDILYSNMKDKESRQEVFTELKKHDVSDYQLNKLSQWMDDFNPYVADGHLSNGFEKMKGDLVDYSNLELKDMPSYYVNCRLTSFMIMRNALNTNCKPDDSDTYLMLDLDAVDTDKQIAMTKEDKLQYATLFNWVKLGNAKTLTQHIRRIESALKERDVYIDNSKGMSLINVYIHSTFDNARFVGHTGVLVQTDDGLLFVEKYGPDTPFQATKFNNRSELKKYLLARPDLYGEKTELAPIITENTKVMKTK
ncbi:DUF4300 family protein [Peptacetobacter sp. AB845]|uniref:DUF4300 family protein n=1 Tax=Peptacetobacter sp. AB845 TaxID=3388429 RepID=UPI0039C93173